MAHQPHVSSEEQDGASRIEGSSAEKGGRKEELSCDWRGSSGRLVPDGNDHIQAVFDSGIGAMYDAPVIGLRHGACLFVGPDYSGGDGPVSASAVPAPQLQAADLYLAVMQEFPGLMRDRFQAGPTQRHLHFVRPSILSSTRRIEWRLDKTCFA